MKIPVVKEWGSWAVFLSSCVAAFIAGLLTRPWESGRSFQNETLLTVLGLALLINAKNPIASLLRTRSGPLLTGGMKKEHLLWSLIFIASGAALLIPFLINGLPSFLIFTLLILSYVILLKRGKEHHIAAELNGFALLTLSAPIVYFVITCDLSIKLYAVVLIFFAAGVFKVRVRTRKTMKYRWIMAGYCALAVIAYLLMDAPVVLLLPLLENIWTVLFMREEKLKATGYSELAKAVVFVVLIGLYWH